MFGLRPSAFAATLLCVSQGMMAPPSLALGASDTERLLKVIEEQQRRLDAQEAQLAEQKKALQALRQEVAAIQRRNDTAEAPRSARSLPMTAPSAPGAESSATAAAAPGSSGFEGLDKAVSAAREEWPGSFGVSGSDTRFKISGFTELDMIHDTNNIATPTALVTQAIQTRGPGKNDGQTSFSVQATRLALETRTPLAGSTPDNPRRVTTFIAADFFNNLTSNSPDLRLREAYGEVSDFLHSGGDLLLGQTWSAYTSLYAIPSTLEFWGPPSIFGARNPTVRWTMPVADGLKLKLAAEAGDLRNFETDDLGQIDSSDPTINVESRQRWPDGVVALEWEGDSFHLTGGFIARDLQARADDSHIESAFGWAATLGGRIGMPDVLKDDFLQLQFTYGEGIGSLFNDFPPDAVYDVARNALEPIETLGLLFGYQHWWSPTLYSVGSYGWLKLNNEDVQLPTAYKETTYGSLNLVWAPDPRWLLGAEVVYGSREDKDGESGSNVRTVITGRFNF
jgi:hypothetical protein